jgi:hypothetical protein
MSVCPAVCLTVVLLFIYPFVCSSASLSVCLSFIYQSVCISSHLLSISLYINSLSCPPPVHQSVSLCERRTDIVGNVYMSVQPVCLSPVCSSFHFCQSVCLCFSLSSIYQYFYPFICPAVYLYLPVLSPMSVSQSVCLFSCLFTSSAHQQVYL